MSQDNKEEGTVIIWEAPVIVKPEFRLYYDDTGHVVCYTCEKLEGNYIVIDAMTFAESRPDIRVVEGKITTAQEGGFVSKLMPEESIEKVSKTLNIDIAKFSAEHGTICAEEDLSIIVDKRYKGKKTIWKLATYELR